MNLRLPDPFGGSRSGLATEALIAECERIWNWGDGMTKPRWTQQYYDAVEYYFWGPDKLKPIRKADATSNVAAVLNRLRRLEEPLNHILTLFLDLAPNAFRRELALRS